MSKELQIGLCGMCGQAALTADHLSICPGRTAPPSFSAVMGYGGPLEDMTTTNVFEPVFDKDWCMEKAQLEGDLCITAGVPSPLAADVADAVDIVTAVQVDSTIGRYNTSVFAKAAFTILRALRERTEECDLRGRFLDFTRDDNAKMHVELADLRSTSASQAATIKRQREEIEALLKERDVTLDLANSCAHFFRMLNYKAPDGSGRSMVQVTPDEHISEFFQAALEDLEEDTLRASVAMVETDKALAASAAQEGDVK
jgi:hypothetical protein